jgi:hypothetical protein
MVIDALRAAGIEAPQNRMKPVGWAKQTRGCERAYGVLD